MSNFLCTYPCITDTTSSGTVGSNTYGVAKQARIVSVKVLNAAGCVDCVLCGRDTDSDIT